jgi:cell division protein FtsN
MKRAILYVFVITGCVAMISCKGNYEATKAAYEKAMAAAVEKPTITSDIPTDDAITEIQPMVTRTTVARERSESVRAIDGNIINEYSVVVGTFKQKTNACGMRDRLIADGYPAFVAQNAQGTYRVIACSYDSRREAEEARKELMNKYDKSYINDPWLLIKQ